MTNKSDPTDRTSSPQKKKNKTEASSDNHPNPAHPQHYPMCHRHTALHSINDANKTNQSHIALQIRSCQSNYPSSSTLEFIMNNRSPNTGKNQTRTSREVQPSRTEVTNQSSMDSPALDREGSSSALEVESSNFRSRTARAARLHSARGPNQKPCLRAHTNLVSETDEVHATRRPSQGPT